MPILACFSVPAALFTGARFRARAAASKAGADPLRPTPWSACRHPAIRPKPGQGYYLSPCRAEFAVGLVAGVLGMATALAWAWLDWTGRLPEPAADEPAKAAPDEIRDTSA